MKPINKELMKLTLLLALFPVVCVLIAPMKASAVIAADWKAGRIIDDVIFTDEKSMTVNQIQSFLNSRVPECDNDGSEPISSGSSMTRAEWAIANGRPGPPYTCLRDYYEVPKTQPGPGIPANNYGNKPTPNGAKSAAQIIWDAAQAYEISPKVLLTTIEKESYGPLTSDPWPYEWFYTYAMGAHCPDSGPNGEPMCDENYAGFSMQVRESAKLFRQYLNGMDQPWWGCIENGAKVQCPSNRQGGSLPGHGYKVPFTTNFILWDVESSCGGANIFIENKATAALYYYTPYQPNQAALNNMYGTGDSCSAYGNRNFWRIFNDWFGTTYAANESWSLVSQELFNDSSLQLHANPSILSPGKTYYARVRAKNTGPAPWEKGKVNLATSAPNDRNSMFCNDSWITCNRPATLKENTVKPGKVGTFVFPVIMPNDTSSHKEYFRPVVEGITWMRDIGMHWTFSVKQPTNYWKFVSQGVFSDPEYETTINNSALSPENTYYVRFNVLNYGNNTWESSQKINLGTSNPQDRNSAFCDNSWLTCNRPAKLKQSSVKPGEIGTFEFSVKTPATYGNYKEYFRPVAETIGWMNDLGLNLPMHVKKPTYEWSYVNQNLYTDETKSIAKSSNNIVGDSRYYAVINIRNTGNVTWSNAGSSQLRLGTTSPNDRASKFCDSTWPTPSSCNRPAKLKQSSVKPGEIGTFEFWVKAPYATDGTEFKEYFKPVIDGKTWLQDIGLHYKFNMNSPDYIYSYVDQAAFTNSNRTSPANLLNASNNKTYYLTLRIRNTGGKIWSNSGSSPLRLGTSNPQDRNSAFCDNSWLTCNRPAKLKQSSVKPGEIGTFEFSVKTPADGSADISEYFRPVVESLQWMADIGIHYRIVY